MIPPDPTPKSAEYFCLPVALACLMMGTSLVAGIWWLA
jgi:hypothetical protein